MKRATLYVLLLALPLCWSGCSEDRSLQPSKSHPESWVKAASTTQTGHGAKVLVSGLASCASCHGSDFRGGTSKVSCFKCHETYPHGGEWSIVGHSLFHGRYLAGVGYETASCTPCHGQDLQDSDGKKNCRSCHALYPHAVGWQQKGAAAFHGAWAKNANWDLTACKGCHGPEFQGSVGKQSCYACHGSYPHNKAWLESSSIQSHGAWLSARNFNLEECKACHGATYQGGDGKQSCYTCHASYPHQASFKYEQNNAQFHGAQLKLNSYDLTSCADCHGSDYRGGISARSCFKCHTSYPHDENWSAPEAASSHIAWLRGHGHDLASCQKCHGSDYLGGTSGKSCTLCHTGSGGPENCTLCHGSADGIQPPKDTQGNTAETAMGVGRHQFHVVNKKYTCLLCHTVPAAYADPGHVQDDTPGRAEILALWQWNHTSATCVTNCHVNDPSKNYVWNH